MGDPGGIGPEVTLAALRDPGLRRVLEPVLVGARSVLARRGWRPGLAPLLDPGVPCRGAFGRPTKDGGAASFEAVRLAYALAEKGIVDGIVTAPISKEAWAMAGVRHTDHTGFLET